MPVDERARHELHTRLEQILGSDEATTLMSYLPPVGWADVATKRDLELLETRLRGDVALEISRQTRLIVLSILASNATLAGLAFAAAHLA